MTQPFFSVIMPAYNAGAFLPEAVRSVLDQRFELWELIIIDDGSTDDTGTIAGRFTEEDPRVHLISQNNLGLNDARKTGMKAAKGKWIAFLDADDMWLASKLQRQYAAIQQYPSVDVVFTNGYTLPYDTPVKLHYHFQVASGTYSGEAMFRKLFQANCIPVLSACIRSAFVPNLLTDQEAAKGSEDWDYWLTLAEKGATFLGLADRLFIYRLHPDSMSARIHDQRLSSALILMRHFDNEKLSPGTIRRYKRNIAAVHQILVQNGRKTEANSLAGAYQQYHPAEQIKHRLFVPRNMAKSLSAKQMIKKTILTLIQLLFFRPYSAYLKHAHNFRVQYIRWKMGSNLETKGDFFVAREGDIRAINADAKLTTHGLYLGEYSRINLAGKGYVYTGSEIRINNYCHFNIWNGELLIGNNVLFNNYCSVNCMESIHIGDQTWFGEGVRIYDHNHAYKDPDRPFTDQGMRTGKISIGNNCWIGSNTVILQNVTIGDNCVIGANNLIFRSIPAGTVVKANTGHLMEDIHD